MNKFSVYLFFDSFTSIFDNIYIKIPDEMDMNTAVIPKKPISSQMIRDPKMEMVNMGWDGSPETMVIIRK